MRHHHLASTPVTCHNGFFDAARPAQIAIESGDTITIDTLTGTVEMIAAAPGHTPPELRAVREGAEAYPAPHILTGPVAVAGAEPGDVLEVRILKIELRQDWGFNLFKPIGGTLPDHFPDERLLIIPIDRAAMTCTLPFGVTLPLKPFFGIMGVAPPPGWGRITSVIPRAHGGNIDNKELGPGSTLYLPVHMPGGLFSCGDGHGIQGDGEVCLTALETALTGTFQMIVRKDMALTMPRAETDAHLITMGFDPSLDRALEIALRDMIAWLGQRHALAAADAYSLCSLAADFRVTQSVNGAKGIHGMIAKSILPA